MLIIYTFETIATNVTDNLSKFETNLMTSISDLMDVIIINLKEIIIKKLQDDNTILANKVVKMEDKINNLKIQNTNLSFRYP